jgi:hypothetical protein
MFTDDTMILDDVVYGPDAQGHYEAEDHYQDIILVVSQLMIDKGYNRVLSDINRVIDNLNAAAGVE